MIKFLKAGLPIGLSILGTLAVIGGELDDAPGLGGIGLILISISFYLSVKNNK